MSKFTERVKKREPCWIVKIKVVSLDKGSFRRRMVISVATCYGLKSKQKESK